MKKAPLPRRSDRPAAGGSGLQKELSSRSHGGSVVVMYARRVRKIGRPGSIESRILRELGGRSHIPALLSASEEEEEEGCLRPALEIPYLDDRRARTVPEALVLVRDVAEALAALHLAGYVHRDVKRPNVRFDGQQATLIDYDIAKECKSGDKLQGAAGTRGWRAPEVVAGVPYDGPAADVWGLAVVLLDELLMMNGGRSSAHSICCVHSRCCSLTALRFQFSNMGALNSDKSPCVTSGLGSSTRSRTRPCATWSPA